MLQEHSAKHIYKVPDGLRELCADISREVYYYFYLNFEILKLIFLLIQMIVFFNI